MQNIQQLPGNRILSRNVKKKLQLSLYLRLNKKTYYASNYRPIFLLEVLGKIFERLFNHRLRPHLELNNHYTIHRFGFRFGRGTTHALEVIT